jgi:hypothetical protein
MCQEILFEALVRISVELRGFSMAGAMDAVDSASVINSELNLF